MAYNVTNFSDYVARESKTLTKTLFVGGDTGKFAMAMGGIKGSTTVPHVSGTTLQGGSCPSPSGTSTVTEVTITVAPFTVFEGYCQDDLQDKFPNTVLAPGSNNHDAPAEFEEALVAEKIAATQETLELTYWQGNTASGSYKLFDGFIKKIDAASGPIDGNTGSVTSLTKANIISVIDAIRVAAPAKVKRNKNFSILVGDDVFDMYIAALKAANLYHYSAEHDNGVLKLGGSQGTLYRVYGLDGTDRIFASVGSNFVIGSDVEDENKVADVFYDQTDDKVYLRIKGKAGVAIANPSEIVEFTLDS